MTHEQNCTSLALGDVLHFTQTLLLKLHISHCQDLVNNQNLWIEMGGHCKSQAQIHTTAIVLDRRVNEFVHFSECNDLIKLAVNLCLPHTENSAVQVNILSPAQLGVEASPYLQQRAHPALNLGIA